MRLLSYPQAGVPAELRTEVERLDRLAWPGSASSDHDPELLPLRLLLVDDRVVATLAVLTKRIEHAGTTFLASGLSAVTTEPERRKEGLGHQLVISARSAMREHGADLALFTADRELVTFYETAGFQELPGTVVLGGTPEDPLPSDTLGKVALAAFFTDHAKQHAGAFVGARIALYPGTIDKLW